MKLSVLVTAVYALFAPDNALSAEVEPSDATLTWVEVLLFVGVPAAFGGILQALHRWSYGDDANGTSKISLHVRPRRSYADHTLEMVISGLFGMGGGAAVLLAALWLKVFDMFDTDANKLYLVVLGVVSGFIGYRVLPQVARGLEERMDITEHEARRAMEDSVKAVRGATDAAKNAFKAQRLATVAYLIQFKDFRKAKKDLLQLREEDRLHRYINTSLSFVCKLLEEYDEAISVMSQYAEELKRTPGYPKEDYAVALYNRACYRTLQARKRIPYDEALLQLALSDLEEAIREDPENRTYAAEPDEDFEFLKIKKSEEFSRIVGQGLPSTSSSMDS